jgi:hypothetical protein
MEENRDIIGTHPRSACTIKSSNANVIFQVLVKRSMTTTSRESASGTSSHHASVLCSPPLQLLTTCTDWTPWTRLSFLNASERSQILSAALFSRRAV